MDRPDAADVRAVLPQATALLTRAGYPAPTGDPPPDDPLEAEVEAANEYVEQMTGRQPLETEVPAGLEATALRAVALRTLQQVVTGRAGFVVTAATNDLIQSFSAGSYSETRRDPNAKLASVFAWLNPWPALAQLLWLLSDEDKRDEMTETATGAAAPAFATTEVDWAPADEPRAPGWPGWGYL